MSDVKYGIYTDGDFDCGCSKVSDDKIDAFATLEIWKKLGVAMYKADGEGLGHVAVFTGNKNDYYTQKPIKMTAEEISEVKKRMTEILSGLMFAANEIGQSKTVKPSGSSVIRKETKKRHYESKPLTVSMGELFSEIFG